MITLDKLDLKSMTGGKLGELLIEAKNAYYTTGKPIMDDHTYDTLEEILRKTSPHHRIFTKVGNSNFSTGFDKKHHAFPLNSQNKASNFTDMVHYFELKKIPTNTLFLVQPKCDGLSLEIEYQKGKFVDAVTRGDGFKGDVISQNAVKMHYFSQTLPLIFTGSIRFEIVVTQKDFVKLNKISDTIYTNPRNAASGISQRLDSKYSDYCTLIAVDIFSKNQLFTTETTKINFLKKLNILTVDTFYCQSFEEIENIYQSFLKKRTSYPFEIDGLVIKIDDTDIQSSLGSKNNRPKYQVAYKFPADSSQSRLVNIDWQVGPLGNVTPVAQIDPILISGATITYISLSNIDQINNLSLNIGDIVEVSRRGDVIPHIDRLISKVSTGTAVPPKNCPVCHSPLTMNNKFLKCPNTFGCPAQTLGQLNLFCKVLKIKGISSKTITKFNKSGVLNYPGDFYKLTTKDISTLDNLGDKSAQNIVKEIQAKRNITLLEVFHSASIPNLSKARLKQLIDAGFDTPQKIINIKKSDLLSLPGFKITLAQKIVNGISLRRKNFNSILDQVNLIKATTSQKLLNKVFCITGELSVPRSEIESYILNNGGKLASSVSSKTNFLVTNQTVSNSSKFITAQLLNIPIINEQKLLQLINS